MEKGTSKCIEYRRQIGYISTDGITKRPHNILKTKAIALIRSQGGIVDDTSQENDPVSITTQIKYRLPKGIQIELPKD